MKKLIAMLLCAVMLLSMAAFATAEEEFHIAIVTVTGHHLVQDAVQET